MCKKEEDKKRGPEADRLKIEGDPQEALRKLLRKRPEETKPKEEGDAENGEN